jgi:hypothetical protein
MGAISYHTLSLGRFVAGPDDSLDGVFARSSDDGGREIELERVSLGEAEQLTDLRYRVVRPAGEP